MTDQIIVTEDLTVFYVTHCGIADVNLTVQKGEVFGLLGLNGAGKTTLQRVLMDVIRPTKGHAAIFGRDCRQTGTEIRRRVGYLPGEFSFYANMNGASFINLLASMQGRPVDRAYQQQLYDRLDLDPSRKLKTYSRGNKQKFGVMAGFMGRPDLLILDEPTVGLDPLVQKVVLELVRETRDDGRAISTAAFVILVAAGLGSAAALHGVKDVVKTSLTAGRLDMIILSGWFISEAFIMMGLFLSAYLPNRRFAAAVMTFYFIASYLVETITEYVPSLAGFRYLSLFYYFDSSARVFTESVNVGDVLTLLGVALFFFVLAVISIQRRNVTVEAWPWQRAKISK